jgi:(E)-4-hydroxy-3-methylbut-2-enyl-diphosphate synthase
MTQILRNPTRSVQIGSVAIGGGNPIAVQSMTATSTQDVAATVGQVRDLEQAGADVVRIAVDNRKDAEALAEIRRETRANLAVDLQENYRLVTDVAPHVDKVRYNPGHLYHHEREKPWQDKVKFIVEAAAQHDCAIRIGVNCGSVDPAKKEKYDPTDSITPMLESAWEHCELLDNLGFTRYCVSLKDSDPRKVIEVNRRFAERRPDVPLTVPNPRKGEEIAAGRAILSDITAGRVRSVVDYGLKTLNIISCPSCSRVENEAFVELAQQVKEMTRFAEDHHITIAVMGCRVNGPGETDDADLGLWCGPNFVNLKRGSEELGAFAYDAILPKLKTELDALIAQRT